MFAVIDHLEDLAVFVASPFIYLLLLALGRSLKRHFGVKLGLTYQALSIALALYLPMNATGHFFEIGFFQAERELLAIIILLGTLCGLSLFGTFFWDGYFPRKKGVEAPRFVREVVALFVFVVALVAVLGGIYDRGLPGLLAGSGILAIILGLALQDLLGNVFSGIALELGRPFRPGDWLHIDNEYGQVIDVNWRAVRLKTNDDVVLEIPNSTIVKNTIVNLTAPSRVHAMRLPVGVEYGAPPNQVKEILAQATRRAVGVLAQPPPRAFLIEFADSAVLYEIKFYMDDHRQFNAARDAIYSGVWYQLRRAGISIPFPIRTLQVMRPEKKVPPESGALAALRGQPTFESLSAENIHQLVTSGRQVRFGRGECLIEEGENGDSMFVLIEGQAEVTKATENGRQTKIATLKAGDCFGEMSLLTGEKRSATILAVADCEALEISKMGFREVLASNPELLDAFGNLLATRRLENEELLSKVETDAIATRRREYAATFFTRLSAYFGL